jgi:hypothetical protein
MRDLAGLHRHLAERSAMPFAWGDHANDCISAAAAAIVAQGGPDLVGERQWASEAEAEALIEAEGGIETVLDGLLEPVAPAFAQRGDVGAVMAGNRMMLVIIEGETLAGPGPERLRRLPRSLLARAWRAL